MQAWLGNLVLQQVPLLALEVGKDLNLAWFSLGVSFNHLAKVNGWLGT